jgi:uncharacterized protein YjbJ (UPF0337 family)
MNKDQAKGALKNVEGKIQEQAGKLTGNTKQRIKGLTKQVAGKVQQSVGDAKQSIKNFRKT